MDEMDLWLRGKGLGRFTERLQEFGIENIHDLLDSDIVSDVELRNEIGMNQAELIKFRGAVNENRVLDWNHINQEEMGHLNEVDGKPPGYAEFALFVRKLQRMMHFERLDRKGTLHSCSMHMSKGNQAVIFTDGPKRIELSFEAMRGVHGFIHDETGELKHPDVGIFLPIEQAQNALLLTFSYEDDSAEHKTLNNEAKKLLLAETPAAPTVAPSKAKNRWGAALAKTQEEVAEKQPALAKKKGANWTRALAKLKSRAEIVKEKIHDTTLSIARTEGRVEWFDPELAAKAPHSTHEMSTHMTAADGGLLCLLLVCHSREDKVFAAKGFRHSANNYSVAQKLNSTLHKDAGLCSPKWPNWLRCLDYFHHLYRPHHHHNHPPARFHNDIVAEVSYDASIEVLVVNSAGKQVNKVTLPCPVFRPGMYLRAKIKGFDMENQAYFFDYVDGPYLADEDADGSKHFKLPPSQQNAASNKFILRGVKDTFVTVDLYDNYGSALPFFVLGISLMQTVAFVKYVIEENSEVTEEGPVAGPEVYWMKIMSEFPYCEDMRWEWWRPLTYQLVHAGWTHIVFNMFMQITFGLPLNMVHGNIRFAFLYFLGVYGGALAFTVVGGGHGSMVGCSGGVYAIFGMHVAEIIINWDLQHKGIMNHWTRLMVIIFVLAVDFSLYYNSPSETTSYTAHIGGWVVGMVMGVLLLDNLEVEACEKYFLFPMTRVAALFLCLYLPYNHFHNWPPAPLWRTDPDPCCWKLHKCGVEPEDFQYFRCYNLYDVRGGRQWRDTCDEFFQWVEKKHADELAAAE